MQFALKNLNKTTSTFIMKITLEDGTIVSKNLCIKNIFQKFP